MTASESPVAAPTGVWARLPAHIVDQALWLYQATVSPLLGQRCRFAPSCSAYAREAVRRHGVRRGGWMAMRRLLRCHPWHSGGWDPVV